jgi:hypothetical protein
MKWLAVYAFAASAGTPWRLRRWLSRIDNPISQRVLPKQNRMKLTQNNATPNNSHITLYLT